MFGHKAQLLFKAFSTTTIASPSWRIQIQQNQLASQISSILLQRHNWVPLLQRLNLSSKLNPSLFLQILHRTQKNPEISLDFFNWVKSNLRFEPGLKSRCQIIQILIGSGHSQSAKPLLDHLVQTHQASVLVESITQVCKGRDSQSDSLSFVLASYGRKGLFREGLEVYGKMRAQRFFSSVLACNELLDALERQNEVRLAWCLFGATIRDGVLPNRFTWSLVARILCKDGKFEKIARILELGNHSSVIYDLLIDWFSRNGDFDAAFDRLSEMCDRKLNPSFSTCSSILDGACKHGNVEAVERIMSVMVEKKLLSKLPFSEFDSVILKLCDIGKTYAAEMLFRKACDEKIGLQDATYGFLLAALSEERRVDRAIWIYGLISEQGLIVSDNAYNVFASVLLREELCEERYELLMDIIRRGISPCASELSGFITVLCLKRRWGEAEAMLNTILDKGQLPDSFCCSSLVRRYCSTKKMDLALELHNKMEKLNVSLDVTTYNVLLDGLVNGRRIEEALKVFDYMRRHEKLDSESFTIMIKGLCRQNELKRAMKVHDEMLELKLKPDKATYKRLISAFK
ncbi:hypothetical protein UlMin_011381 [Ulmus minor]